MYIVEDTGKHFVFVLDLWSRSKVKFMCLLVNASPRIT